MTRSLTRISEVLLPERSRYYTKLIEGDKTTEYEQITIDYMQYTRNDGGPWVKIDLRQGGNSSGSGSGSGSSRQCEQYSVEPVFLNGSSVQLFESLIVDSNERRLNFRESRKWIGDDGLPYREEELNGKVIPREETGKIVITYEYDPDIKIAAPIK